MSFLAASENTMAFELWPAPMKKEIQRLQGDYDYASWELFPSSLRDMADWADVYQDPERKDKSRDRILIYKHIPDGEPGTVYPVALRLQGLLREFRVERFGNWTGQEADVTRAVQHVTISSGGHAKAWEATIDSLNLACEYVSRRLHLPMQGIPQKKELYLQRRAFIKRDKPRGSKTPALSATQDPEGKYLRIQEHWSAVRPLTIADLTSAGKILPMDAVLLTEGDFVDVGAELDFVLSRQRNKGTTLKCFLTCTHIVRMIPAGYVEKMKLDNSMSDRKRTSTPPPQERPAKKSHTALSFDEE